MIYQLMYLINLTLDQGITTYEYVVAMRAMNDADEQYGNMGNLAEYADEQYANSPSGSTATGMSGGSSLSLHYKGVLCTPPRVFVDYQVIISRAGFRYIDFVAEGLLMI